MIKTNIAPILVIVVLSLVLLPLSGCKTVEPTPVPLPTPVPEPTPTPLPELEPVSPPEEETAEEASTAEAEEEDLEAVQQEALDLCQSAAEFLDQGAVDDAIDALDHAYEMMLQLPENGDELFLQAKDDIRQLVADLIVRTYESQRVAAPPTASFDLALPLVNNELVQREIKSFTNGERQVFLEAYRRSGLYRPMMLAKLEEAGLPSQLSWLPLVESNFKVTAYSRAAAVGLWQFIGSTGQRYGLSRDSWVDERRDPEKSTDAAIAYLTDLHDLFGDWPKALAAYNCGEGRVGRLQRRNPSEYLDFWDLYNLLPRETRRYVPRFFATVMIVDDPEKYGIELPEPLPPQVEWTHTHVNKALKLDQLDTTLGLSVGTLKALNPELRHGATPSKDYALKIPADKQTVAVASVESTPEWKPPTPTYVTHRVRRGETLSRIAQRYGSSVSSIMRSNNIRSANRIWPGQRLKIPAKGAVVSSSPSFNPVEGTHTVRRGENLYSIARRYSTTVERIKHDNRLSSSTIHPGQKLKVSAGSRTDLKQYTVSRGDTPSGIASAHGVSLSALLRANGLSSRSTIYPGQVLAIP